MSNQRKIPINRVKTKGVIYKTINHSDKVKMSMSKKNSKKFYQYSYISTCIKNNKIYKNNIFSYEQ
jgi:hypothetical protein